VLLDLGTSLCLRNWERALPQKPLYGRKEVVRRLREAGLGIDLSRVGWVEPSTALRLVLFVERMLYAEVPVTVLLPRAEPTQAEAEILDAAFHRADSGAARVAAYVRSAVRRRRDALAVLHRMEFVQALQCEHLGSSPGGARLTVSPSPGQPEEIGSEDPSDGNGRTQGAPWYCDIVYPLSWVADPGTPEGASQVETMAESAGPLSPRVLSRTDCLLSWDSLTLVYVLLQELVENTIIHGGRTHALVCGWLRPSASKLREHELLPCETPFAGWTHGYPIIEFAVGDSGRGVPATLGPYYRELVPDRPAGFDGSEDDRILVWAFGDWVRRPNGREAAHIGGLYYVRRIAHRYAGLVTLRSERSYAGYDYSPRQTAQPHEIAQPSRLAPSPGTAIQVRLPIMSAERATAGDSLKALDWQAYEFSVLPVVGSDWQTVASYARTIRGECSTAPGRSECLVADFMYASAPAEAVKRIFEDLLAVAGDALIVVVNLRVSEGADAEADVLDSATQGAKDWTFSVLDCGKKPPSIVGPFLYRQSDGTFRWVGMPAEGQPDKMYASLVRHGRMSLTEIQALSGSRERLNRQLRLIAEYYPCARLLGGEITLLPDVGEFAKSIRDAEQRQVEAEGRRLVELLGQRMGTSPLDEPPAGFLPIAEKLTPAEIDRFAYALARKTVLSIDDLQRTGPHAPIGLTEHLEVSRTGSDLRVEARPDVNPFLRKSYTLHLERQLSQRSVPAGPTTLDAASPTQQTLLLTDLLTSANPTCAHHPSSLRPSLSPIALVTLLDWRDTPSATAEEGGVPLPVVSLARAGTARSHATQDARNESLDSRWDQPMPAAATCFLSYAHEDAASARRLYDALSSHGVKVWFDRVAIRPGERWEHAVSKGIRESRYFLALLSSRAVSKRGFVQREIREALELLAEYPDDGIYVIPLRLDDCVPSHDQLRGLQWVDLFPVWNDGLERLVGFLGTVGAAKERK